ncbi:MAG TPA: type II toxin-antitoxin system VapC family toxin [Rectinemataceae bacterium]|nr:type II toxin-antitoxin system VapC family toxin [Rectinemataceae bacterium]
MTYVLDASVAGSLFLPDEEAETARSILAGLGNEDVLLVPPLFWYEMANVVSGAVRKGRLDEGPAFRALEMLRRLGLKIDTRQLEEVTPGLVMLARSHELSSYDAAYLELAAREGATLCSHDGALRGAALSMGLELLPRPA